MDKIEFETVTDVESEPQIKDKVETFQKKYNVVSKNLIHALGKNITLFICMMLPLLLVAFIWVDFAAIIISPKLITDGIVTVLLFITGEAAMTRLGSDGGKLDADFISSKKEYDDLSSKVKEIGIDFMGIFCNWQIDLELKQAVIHQLRLIHMTLREYEAVKDLSKEELEKKFGSSKAAKILEINNLKPIELNEAILLYDGEKNLRGGIPESGDKHLKSKKHIVEVVISCLFTGLLTVSVAMSMTTDVNIARVVYTAYKLVMMLWRMASGYNRGARAFNTIQVKANKAKSNYLRQYLRFVEEKIYLKLGDKYGDVPQFMGDYNDVTFTEEKTVKNTV